MRHAASRARCRAVLLAAPMLFAVPAAADAEPELMPGLERWTDGLGMLHSSRVEDALEAFRTLGQARPGDVCGYYFPALVYMHFDVEDVPEEQEIERGRVLLDQGIEIGQARLDDPDVDPGTRYCTGALYGLRAEDRLNQSKMLGTALDAKRGRRVMLDLLEDEPGCIDCRFWTGSYDYYADVVPGVIKFFRTLLFFPKGDKERGLATLEEVAEHGRIDRYAALWVLYSLYRGLEDQPALALESLETLRRLYPDDVGVPLTLARHYFREASPPDRARGLALLVETLKQVEAREGADGRRQSLRVRLGLTQAYLSDLQPESAVETALPAIDLSRGHEEEETEVAFALVRALNHAGRHADALGRLETFEQTHPESEALPELRTQARSFDEESSTAFHLAARAWRAGRQGRVDSAERDFGALIESGHAPGLVLLMQAEMYQELERYADAATHYGRAVEDGVEGPSALLPLAYIRLGNLADLRRDHAAAKRYYHEAAENAGEHEWARFLAKTYVKEPYTGDNTIRWP